MLEVYPQRHDCRPVDGHSVAPFEISCGRVRGRDYSGAPQATVHDQPAVGSPAELPAEAAAGVHDSHELPGGSLGPANFRVLGYMEQQWRAPQRAAFPVAVDSFGTEPTGQERQSDLLKYGLRMLANYSDLIGANIPHQRRTAWSANTMVSVRIPGQQPGANFYQHTCDPPAVAPDVSKVEYDHGRTARQCGSLQPLV
jgi:hypothetical protein